MGDLIANYIINKTKVIEVRLVKETTGVPVPQKVPHLLDQLPMSMSKEFPHLPKSLPKKIHNLPFSCAVVGPPTGSKGPGLCSHNQRLPQRASANKAFQLDSPKRTETPQTPHTVTPNQAEAIPRPSRSPAPLSVALSSKSKATASRERSSLRVAIWSTRPWRKRG